MVGEHSPLCACLRSAGADLHLTGLFQCLEVPVATGGDPSRLGAHSSSTPCDLLLALSVGTGSSILSALQDLFWLSKSKVEKQLQIISVLQWVLTFLVMGKQRPLARSEAS